ncbi:MAG: DEAD/DEAH box helicase [Desulfocapsaceae bacterium]|nr:DEAD/DEAH box helicase [Desulfocapsaceae bacterium]
MTIENDLLQQYRNLSHFEQTLLQFLSIVYEPANIPLVVSCLNRLELRSARGQRPTAANLNHYLAKFQQLNLLSADRQCAVEIVETLSRYSVAQGTFPLFAKIIREEAPVSYYYGKWTTRCWRAMRELRIGIYMQQLDLIDDASAFITSQCRGMMPGLPLTIRVTACPFDLQWFRGLSTSFQFYLLDNVLRYSQAHLIAFPEILYFLSDRSEFENLSIDEQLPFKRLLFNQLLLQGKLVEAESLTSSHPELFSGTGSLGTLHFLRGNQDKALAAYADDIAFLQNLSGSEKVAFFGPSGLFYILAQLQQRDIPRQEIAQTIGLAQTLFPASMEQKAYSYLTMVLDDGVSTAMPADSLSIGEEEDVQSLTLLFAGLCQYWLNSSLQPEVKKKITVLYTEALKNGYLFFALIFAEILEKIADTTDEYQTIVKQLRQETGIVPLIAILEPEEPWKRSLQALIQATAIQTNPAQSVRMAWMIEFERGIMEISPREQKLTPAGEWTKGRPLSLARLAAAHALPYLSVQDRKVCLAIDRIAHPDSRGVAYKLDMDKALVAMIGHPQLFLSSSPTTPVEFIAGEPELLVQEKGNHLHIRFAQNITSDKVTVFRETPTRFKIITINDNHRRIAQITGKDGLTVPLEASEQVLTAIGNISSFMTVHSAIAADASTDKDGNINFVEADPSIYMHLLPYGTGFRLEMFVKPFKDGVHYLKPGQGVENIMAEVGGKRLQTRRNLALEEEHARNIEELCPIFDLAIDLEHETDREWRLLDPDDCLQALLELQAIKDQVIIEWPEGEKLTVSHQASFKNLNLKIRTNRQNWFSMSGQLVLDQEHIIDLKELLTKVKTASGRFIQIGEGQFLALTQEFKKRLEDINIYAEEFSEVTGDEIQIHPLAAIPLEELVNQASTFADAGWKNQLSRIKEIQNFVPEMPSTLQAELRDYQTEGFNWLARLAQLGVGACLADDMGLGKTLQSLAIILKYAADGPSLVVAPTSVSTNWLSEVNRFTPTLNIISLPGKDRAKAIGELGRFDLLITTYTLLQQETELLAGVKWQTIILDEAQAIKNAATKRSRAAMSLQARFKLITTGTPIENHLGELWNLFHFINPGLLGTIGVFNERFAIPIERYHDRDAKMKLKKLIRPFILRRIKSQVLDELPPRTEVTLEVEMSPEEADFYEALRQNALDILESNKERKGRHLQILTEIMKLRQACCNPRLITPDLDIPSSKLEVFSGLVEELIGGRHKALVFSQFIGHLKIIREYLDAKNIPYQYLDGSTGSKQRQQRIEAFQSGEGDLFLISLKAGGLGLNLTAADYVIHMDPWWNPAIEDQASDRAHRIGQTRPVTIYRLVCKNSIEEKIVKLHEEKRDLAGSLLEGSDISARMNSNELMDLIREG